jgi:hypothetical protein
MAVTGEIVLVPNCHAQSLKGPTKLAMQGSRHHLPHLPHLQQHLLYAQDRTSCPDALRCIGIIRDVNALNACRVVTAGRSLSGILAALIADRVVRTVPAART